MANTNEIKTKVHPYVRDWLKQKYGIPFGRNRLPLRDCDGFHEFAAVSTDGKIVAEIKAASGKTSGGKHPSGKRASAFEQLYFLLLAIADTKLLILTNLEFLEIIKEKSAGNLPADIQLVYCPLPPELETVVEAVTQKASNEIDRGKKAFQERVPNRSHAKNYW